MTLVVAAYSGSTTVVVADRAREFGGVGPPVRDERARKIVTTNSGDVAIAVVGDVILGTAGFPETVIASWMPGLEAERACDRRAHLRSLAEARCGRPSDGRIGLLLFFDRTAPSEVAVIKVSAAAVGVTATLDVSTLAETEPTVWGLENTWSSLGGAPWAAGISASEQVAAIRAAIANYALYHPGSVVSAATCAVTLSLVAV